MKTRSIIKLLNTLIAIFLLGACAQTPAAPGLKPVTLQGNPVTSVTDLGNDIARARQNQIDVLAPDGFSKAETFYAKAQKGIEGGSDIPKILKNVANGKASLSKAEETAKVARTMLAEVLESRNKARRAGAADLGERYTDLEKQFLDLTRAIEDNNIRYTQKTAPKVEKAYLALELAAIKANSIEKVRPLITRAIDEKAEKYVPRSLLMAQKSIDDTDNFITNNRYASEAIDRKVNDAMFLAQRALILNHQSQALEKMKPEETALGIEKNLQQITTRLSAQDSRNQTVDVQVETILGSITRLQEENRSLNVALATREKEYQDRSALCETQVTALNQRIDALESTAQKDRKLKSTLLAEQKAVEQKLAAEREFNKKYLEVQTYFRANEAEVYKQRNQLVIRLKAMQFPVGTAIISPENFTLLSKIQRAIRTFDGPSVVIEGHTDSTGGDEINQVLSKQRAEAVRAYLVANQTIRADKIDARGYGPTRPLASNTTPEGRAINRRIDVIITPPLMPGQ